MKAEEWRALCERFPQVPAGFEIDARVEPAGPALSFGERPVIALAFSADGRRVAVSGGGMIPGAVSIHVFDLEAMERVAVCRYHARGVHDLAFSASGLLASVSHDYSVVLWNLEQGDAAFLAGGPFAGVSRTRAVFRGSELFVGDGMTWGEERAALRVFDLDRGRADELFTLDDELGITQLELTPEGDALVVIVDEMRIGGPPYEVRSVGLDGAERSRFALQHSVYDACALDRARVVLVGSDPSDDSTRAWLLDESGAVICQRVIGDEISGSLARSPDGSEVAVGHVGRVEICAADDLSERRHIELGQHRVTRLAWSPDGRWIAAGTFERVVRIFDASTGIERVAGA